MRVGGGSITAVLTKCSNECEHQQTLVLVSHQVVDMWKQRDVALDVPESVDVEKFAKPIEPLDAKMQNNNVPVSVTQTSSEEVASASLLSPFSVAVIGAVGVVFGITTESTCPGESGGIYDGE